MELSSCYKISGAIYPGVPHTAKGTYELAVIASPKSIIFNPFTSIGLESTMFSNFISLWMYFYVCNYLIPYNTYY